MLRWMRWRASLVGLINLWACVFLLGCGDAEVGPAELTAVTPARVTNLVTTPAVLSGKNLYNRLESKLDNGTAPSIRSGWRVAVGSTPMADVQRRDAQTLSISIPSGLPVGTHDVVVTTPSDQKLILADALTVTEEPLGLSLHIEDAPGGDGGPVGDREIGAGDTLALFAVARDEGRFVADVVATWASTEDIGPLAPGPATSTILEATRIGVARVTATLETAGDASTGDIRVRAGVAASVAVETQAGGAGGPVGDRLLSTDDTLGLFAVSRDALGNFVANEPVSWMVSGDIGTVTTGETASATFDATKPNVGTVEISHATLATQGAGLIEVFAGKVAKMSVSPSTLTLSADDPPEQFVAVGEDADGNATDDLGNITWSVATGPIGDLDAATGGLDPATTGTGTIEAESSYGPSATSGNVTITSGQLALLFVSPDTLTLSADDAPAMFSATGTDGDGNPTAVGTLTWSIASGQISAIDPGSGLFDPTNAGSGTVRATSDLGPLGDSGAITVNPGQAAAVAIIPDTLTLSADDAPVTFGASATDSDGNTTTDVGTLDWSIATGPITAIDALTGNFDPQAAGTGTVRVVSSYGPTDDSGAITVNAGQAATLTVAPDTADLFLSAATQTFTVTGQDSDTNPTLDLGAITWSVSSGPIASIDSNTGLFTPTAEGVGTVRATSSFGFFDDSGAVSVNAKPLEVVSVLAPATIVRGQSNVRVEVFVLNSTAGDALLTDARLSFAQGGMPLPLDYKYVADYQNPTTLGPGATERLVFWVVVSGSPSFGTVDITGAVEALMVGLGAFASDANTTAWDVLDVDPPSAVITGPDHPNNRVCVGDPVDFDGTASINASSFAWDFEGASPPTSNQSAPTGISYAAAGSYPFDLTVANAAGDEDTALGATPIYVGEVIANDYPTGEIIFEAPFPGEVADIDRLPDDRYIDMGNSGATRLYQCDGSDLSEGGPNNYVTLFVDRGTIDPVVDINPVVPGIQPALHNGHHFDSVQLISSLPTLEGAALVYAEFRKEPEGVVTASGFVSFSMGNDTERPFVDQTFPIADCGSACAGKGERLLLRFNEPMDEATLLANVTVEWRTAANCVFNNTTDITGASSLSYDPETRILEVIPPAQPNGTYSLFVTVGALAADASSNNNTMGTDFRRCAILGNRPAPPAPTLPGVAVSADPFSPDGDLTDDITSFDVTADASSIAVRVDIYHGQTLVRSLLEAAPGAGTHSVVWDGRDGTGRIVPNGNYIYEITVENGLGESSPAFVYVTQVRSAVSLVGVPPRF